MWRTIPSLRGTRSTVRTISSTARWNGISSFDLAESGEPLPLPLPAEQVLFLTNVQRFLPDGLFTPTYKCALISAFADLSLDLGDDSGHALSLSTFAIAEKFIEYYWDDASPYTAALGIGTPRQKPGSELKFMALLRQARTAGTESLQSLRLNAPGWRRLVKKMEAVVKHDAISNVQTADQDSMNCLYWRGPDEKIIQLPPGVAYCFRRFYLLIGHAVRSPSMRRLFGT